MEPTNVPTPHLETGNGRASYEAPTTSLAPVPPTVAAATVAAPQPPAVAAPAPLHAAPTAGGERCMSCGSQLAADQRYCLQCGQRQGEPRLPFMDATSMMDVAVQRRQPPAAAPTPPRRSGKQRISANTALIAGVGTLLLALGIGVLIGRSGDHSAATTAATPQIIKVGGGETANTTASTAGPSTDSAKKKSGGGDSGGGKTGSSSQTEAAADVLNPTTKLPPAEVEVGDKGSGPGFNKKHEFTGNFFGE